MAYDLKAIISVDDNGSPALKKFGDTAQKTANEVGGAFTGLANKFNLIPAAITAMGTAAAGGAFSAFVNKTVSWDLEVGKLAKSLGMATEEASVFKLALDDVGIEQELAISGAMRLAKTLNTNEEAFARLGVSTRDANGNYRSTAAIMADVNTALGNIRAGTDRNVAGMQIYGKSWTEMQALLKLTSKGFGEAAEAADRLNLKVNDEQVAQAREYKKMLNELEDVAMALKIAVGRELLPELKKLGDYFIGKTGNGVSEFIKGLHSVEAEIIRMGMLADKAGGTLTTLGMFLFGPGRALGNKNSTKQFEQMADWNIMFEERYKGKDKMLQKLANLEVGLDENGNPIKKASSRQGGKPYSNDTEDAAEKERKAQAERLKLFRDTAKNILEIEKQNVKDRLAAEQSALNDLRKKYEERVKILGTFSDTMKGVKASWAIADKAKIETNMGFETPEAKQRRLVDELRSKENEIVNSWSMDPSEKVKALNDMTEQYRGLFQEVRDGNDVIISKQEADANLAAAEIRLRGEIMNVANDMKVQEDNAVSMAEEIINLETNVKTLNAQMSELDRIIRALPDVKTIDIKLNIEGMSDLRQVTGAMGYQDFGDYYILDGKTYWKGGQLADEGTSFAIPGAATGAHVVKGGLVRVHSDEDIVPARLNRSSAQAASPINVAFYGGINITAPAGSDPKAISDQVLADLGRNLTPVIRRYNSRFL